MTGAVPPDERRAALLRLLDLLAADGYRFVTATPATHARVVGRPGRETARTLRDVLGWSLPFAPDVLPAAILDALRAGEVLGSLPDGRLRATIRVSSVRDALFLHSAYPTRAEDSVFLGPDSYRFADLIVARIADLPAGARILDYGAGAGVGGIVAAMGRTGARLTLADVNRRALFLASINAEHAGVDFTTIAVESPAQLTEPFDVIVANPPFMMDATGRAYRDGGGLYGAELSLDWTLAGAKLLARGGKLILYTGVAIVGGRDALRERLATELPPHGLTSDYRELDPDIFGEELDQPAYAEVERIAAVGLCVTRTN